MPAPNIRPSPLTSIPSTPAALPALKRASRSKSISRETRDRLGLLIKYLETLLTRPLVAQRTGKRAIALVDERLHVYEFFANEFAAVLPRLLKEDKDGLLLGALRGDNTLAEQAATEIGAHLKKRERETLASAWETYLASVQIIIRAAIAGGGARASGEPWEIVKFHCVRTDALLLSLVLLLSDGHAKPKPAVVRALVDEFSTRSNQRYDAAKSYAAFLVDPALEAHGAALATLSTDAPQPDLTSTPDEIFLAGDVADG